MAKKKENLSPEELLEQAVVPEHEWPYEVPENWVWTKVENLRANEESFFDGDWILSENMDSEGSVRLLQLSDIGITEFLDKSKKYINEKTFHELGCSQIFEGDILISRMADPIARSCVMPKINKICITAVDVAVLRCNQILANRKYVNYLFNTPWFTEFAMSLARGTTRVRITRSNLGQLPFPLPPLAEQQRIVDRIESLFEKLDQAKGLIQDALDSFENRKAAILHKAFSGELTRKWREENPTSINMTLEQVLSHYKNNSISKHIRFIEVLQESCEKLASVQNSIWYKCKIGAVAIVTNGSTPSRQVVEFWGGNIPWVSSGEVRNNIIADTRERITDLGYDKSSVKLLPEGTVLMAMIGEGKTRGQSAILDINATINQNIAAIDLSHKMVLSKFVWYWLQKQYQNNREMGNGTGPQALNCQKIRELDIVIPPLKEQIEIVRILDGIISSENSAKEISNLTDNIDLIKKSILARAFRGELETNDLAEESALALLKDLIR